jgi:hypothetical protein
LRGEPTSSSRDEEDPDLGGIGQIAQDADQKAKVKEIVAALEAIVEATDKKEEGLDELMNEVRSKTLALENLLPKPETTAEEAAALDVPGGDLPGGTPAEDPGDAGKAEPGKAEPGKDEPGK